MIQRGGQVVIHMLENVRQVTIQPLIQATIAPGTLVLTDEYDIYCRLTQWGYHHKSVCHSAREYARDEDGDGFHEVHVNTIEAFGPCCAPGCGLTAGSLRRVFPSTSDSSSSFTTLEIAENDSSDPSWGCFLANNPKSIMSHSQLPAFSKR
jgi:hypothetical protein